MWGRPDSGFADEYLMSELPIPLDRTIREEIISCLELRDTRLIADLMAKNIGTTVWAFGMRAASLTGRTANRRWLIAGAVVGEWLGSRHLYDSTTVVGSLFRACSISGIEDPGALLANIADKIQSPAESILRHADSLHSLGDLGIIEEWGDDFDRFIPRERSSTSC